MSPTTRNESDPAPEPDPFSGPDINPEAGIPWPISGRLSGIDFGTVRIGLAICDPSRTWVSPLTTYNRRRIDLDAKYFQELVKKESIEGWVVGLPIHCDGKESQKSTEVREFALWLEKETERPVQFVDERFSTAFAKQLMRPADLTRKQSKARVDRIAAHVILESFLERERNRSAPSTTQSLDDRS